MRMFQQWVWAGAWAWGVIGSAQAATRYVNVSNATPAAPYTNWSMAATNIQPALNAAASGEEILVAPGIYRIAATVELPPSKALTLRSTQSRAAIIDAQRLCQALLINSSNSLVEGFTIRNGISDGYAGGISLDYPSTVRDCLVTSNQAWGGGGIVIFRPGVVENCTIQSNLATYWGGGVIFYNHSTGLVNHCIIRDNIASNYGGGVAFQFEGTVSNSWIAENRAVLEVGGGIAMENGGTLVNSVVVGNRAEQDGGGIYNFFGNVAHCTVVSNTALRKGGGFHGSNATSWNNIVYFNVAPTNENVSGSFSVFSNCCTLPDFGGSNFTNAPAFVDGVARDFHLATASFCIDAGTTLPSVAADFDGAPRPRVGKPGGTAKVDVGAYEYGFHFNDLHFSATNAVDLLWDVQDRGIYRLDADTNGLDAPVWKDVAVYTNPGMDAGQFVVHTQEVVLPSPIPSPAVFRLSISHTVF